MSANVTQHVATESRTTSTEIKVIRCGCGDPLSHNGQGSSCLCGQPTPHSSNGREHICPKPRLEIDLGTVDFHSTDPDLQRAWEESGKAEANARIVIANEGVTS